MVEFHFEEEFFIPDERVCVTVMNGRTDLL